MTNTEILVGTKVLIKKTIMEDKHTVAVAEQMAELAGKIITIDWVGTLATNKKIVAEYGVKGNDGKLYYFDELTEKEIAKLENVSQKNISKSLTIAKNNLKEILKKLV